MITGIKETEEALTFFIALAEAIDKSRGSDKGAFFDAMLNYIPAATKAPQGFAGIEKVPSELKDLDDVERKRIVRIIETLDLKNDKTEEVAEKALISLVMIYTVISDFITTMKANKKVVA